MFTDVQDLCQHQGEQCLVHQSAFPLSFFSKEVTQLYKD